MKTLTSQITVLILDNCQERVDLTILFSRGEANYKLVFWQLDKIEPLESFMPNKLIDIILVDLNFNSFEALNLRSRISIIDSNIPLIFLIDQQLENHFFSKNKIYFFENTEYLLKYELSTNLLEKTIYNLIVPKNLRQELENLRQKNLKLESQLQSIQKLFKTVVNSTSALMWMIDPQEKYTFLNQSWLSFTGLTLEEGLKENWRDRIHPEDKEKCYLAYDCALKKCQGFQIEYRLRRFDNSYRTILNTAVRQHNEKGEFAGLLCSCLDITQRKKAEHKIIKQAHIDRILTEITQDIHISLDLDLILQTATEKVFEYLLAEEISIAKIDNKQLYLLFASGLKDKEAHCNLSLNRQLPHKELVDNFKLLSQGHIITSGNFSLTEIINLDSSDLPERAYSFLLIPIVVNKKLWGLVIVEKKPDRPSWQIDDLKFLERVATQLGVAIQQSELYQELKKLAVVDSLTKIANRRQFDRYLAAEWKRLAREKQPLSLILCDVDHFKLYNDTYGHQAGDRCLQQVALAITKAIKRPADLVARYGGEEFSIILPNTDINGAKYLAQQIRLQIQSLKIPHINSPVDLYVTLSFGISSSIPNNSLSSYALVAAADKGLYKAKELGRNCIVKFELEN